MDQIDATSSSADGESGASSVGSHAAHPARSVGERGAPTLIVGVGASAGGLEALEAFFRAVPPGTGFAFVVVQHLSPELRSFMPQLMQRFSMLTIVPAAADVELRPDTVYVLVPGKQLTVQDGMLCVAERQAEQGRFHPIDTLFASLAALGPRAAAIVLSGTGSDGSRGARLVDAAGGLVIAQTVETARFDGMPRSVLDTRSVHVECSPSEMLAILVAFERDPAKARDRLRSAPPSAFTLSGVSPTQPAEVGSIGAILGLLWRAHGIDFVHYKPATIERRIDQRRRRFAADATIEQYTEHLEGNADELRRLCVDLLIGVTRFFRDPEAYERLFSRVIEPLVAAAEGEQELRFWVCGCSTGEEAYSLAMLALEAMARHGRPPHLRILATDIHPASLAAAAAGQYSDESLTSVPAALRARFFIPTPGGGARVSTELRRHIVFAPHDVVRDSPFSRMDLVSCRNLLIYLKPEAQQRALGTLYTSLKLGGTLFLGESESPGSLSSEFDEADRDAYLFRKTSQVRVPLGLELRATASRAVSMPTMSRPMQRVYDALLDRFIPSGILVNRDQEVLHVFGAASEYLIPVAGRFRGDLPSMLPPGLRSAVLVALRNASQRGESISFAGCEVVDGSERRINVLVDPIAEHGMTAMGYLVQLERAAQSVAPQPGSVSPPPADQVEELERELQMVRERLQHTIEQLESTNQELIAGNEELTASNEELQSTNEELTSVNEELHSLNREREARIRDLDAATADLNNLIRSTGIATIFVDRELRLRLFTPEARSIMPLVQHDVGRSLRDLTLLGDDRTLFEDLDRVLFEQQTIERELAWPDGRHYLRRATPYRDVAGKADGAVITYVDVTEPTRLRLQVVEQEERFRKKVESLPQLVWTCDPDGRCRYLSKQWVEYTGIPEAEQLDSGWLEQVHPEDRQPLMECWNRSVSTGTPLQVEFRIRRHDGVYRWFDTRAVSVRNDAGEIVRWFGSNTDIEEKRAVAARLAASEERFRSIYDTAPASIWDEDWLRVVQRLSLLRAAGVTDFERYFADHPEVVQELLQLVVINDVNPWTVRMFGATSKEQMLQSLGVVFATPDTLPGFVAELCALARGDRVFTTDMLVNNVHGERLQIALTMTFPPPDSGSGQVFVSVADVTGLRAAEAAHRDERARLEAIVTTASQAIVTIDERGNVESVNPAITTMFGYTPAEVVGRNVAMLMNPTDAAGHDGYLATYRRTGERHIIGIGREVVGRRKDGGAIPLHLSISEFVVGGRRMFAGMMDDITEIRRATNDLIAKTRELEASTEQLQRTNLAQQQFIYIVSHDLREPLNTITNFAQLLGDDHGGQLPAEAREFLGYVKQGSERIRRLLDDLLAYVRLERAELKSGPVDLGAVLAEVRSDLAAAFDDRRATVRCDDKLPVVHGQASLLRVLLQNLLDNATKFHEAGSSPQVTIAAGMRGSRIRLTISDNGIGIEREKVARAFEMFRRLHGNRKFPGTGIGLAMCRKIVELHGGSITLESEVGKGTRVVVELPHEASPTPQGKP